MTSSASVDQITHQLDATSLHSDSHRTISKEEIIRADRLIRELHVYAESKRRGTKAKNRNLVYKSTFELPLYDPSRASQAASSATAADNNKPSTRATTTTVTTTATTTTTPTPTKNGQSSTSSTTTESPKEHLAVSRADKNKLKKEAKEAKEAKRQEEANIAATLTKRDDILPVLSWKLNEFEYSSGLLPSLARGLFTYEDVTLPAPVHKPPVQVPEAALDADAPVLESGALAKGTHQILIRGYDKFFNIGEVKKTTLDWIAKETDGPYEVTLKENGCIIFMAGLPPQLAGPEGGCIVSSKHSLDWAQKASNPAENSAATEDSRPEVSHSAKGQEWLEKSLVKKGKTMQEFGRWLYQNNLTAVAELCDDSFEEHVLEYPPDKAGLYLHGLNKNTAEFQTLPSKDVQEAAKEWGLIPTEYVTFNTQAEVMAFADKVRNAGEYDNRAVEGFVVRCKIKKDRSKIHFFKIKYDEPYLMYREWREVTKNIWAQKIKKEKEEALAAAKNKGKDKTPYGAQAKAKANANPNPNAATAVAAEPPRKMRMKYPLTKAYVEFILPLMNVQPELFSHYNKNQGIIAIRELFLKQWNAKTLQEQEAALQTAKTSAVVASMGAVEDFQRTVIIPIATIGCGKTTVSVALSKLFGWTHVSSDDFQHFSKNPGQKFVNEVVQQLKTHTVVIADRNNHEFLHRERIMASVKTQFPKTRFVALYWSHDTLPIDQIRAMQIKRVEERGNNHQNMTPEYCPEFEFVIQKFLKSFTPLNTFVEPDSNFSVVVENKVGEDSLTTVERVVKEFAIPTLGAGGLGNHAIPTSEEIKEAVRYAREEWKPQRVLTGEAQKYHKQKNQPKQESGAADASAAPGTASGKAVGEVAKKRIREPKYFGVVLEAGSVLRFFNEQFDLGAAPSTNSVNGSSHTNAVENVTGPKTDKLWIQLQNQLKEWRSENRIGPSHHVTVVHISARSSPIPVRAEKAQRLWQQYTEEMAAADAFLPPLTQSTVSSPSTSPRGPSSPVEIKVPQAETLNKPTKEDKNDGFVQVGKKKAATGGKKVENVSNLGSPLSSVPSLTGVDLQCTVRVSAIVWTKRIIVLRVTGLYRTQSGMAVDHTQPELHVTVATVNDSVKPFESNEVLKQLNSMSGSKKHSSPASGTSKNGANGANKAKGNAGKQPSPPVSSKPSPSSSSSSSSSAAATAPVTPDPTIFEIKLTKPVVFTGIFKAMLW
ncbi:hypothetical protein BGZ94_005351 [Podila epigama]|nr:hypothetical protein BGZ94_005351 [Podila epigama]